MATKQRKKRTPEEEAELRISKWERNDRAIQGWGSSIGFTVDGYGLDLSGLGLKHIPDGLRALPAIELLDFRNNVIEELPKWIGELSALKGLSIVGNKLRTLPDEIGSLKNLKLLWLDGNQLEELPEMLRSLPLEEIALEGNPKLGLPESILNRPADEVLRYYFESRAEKGRPLLELKLLVVGRGKAGKTTLIKQLAGEEVNKNESETHSIAIRELMLDCPRGSVCTRAWDFGGQEILHSTHQFFLTERSLYLLVLEPRTGSAQRDAEYWLKLIETQGGGSPVIVVMNWSRGQNWKVDEVKLRRKFPFIVDFLPTDALHGEGIDQLRTTMHEVVEARMSDVWLPFPLRWREIKDEVAGMRGNFLTYSQYTELCAMHGEDDPAAQADLAGILHALGLALYFGKVTSSRKTLPK